MDVLQGKEMVGVGNYSGATFIKQGFFFSFFKFYNGDFNAFFGLFYSENYSKISKTSNFFRFFKLKFYHQK